MILRTLSPCINIQILPTSLHTFLKVLIRRIAKLICYMACSVSGQDKPNSALWLVTWAVKMKLQYLACSGQAALSCKKTFPKIHITNPLLTELVWSRWLNVSQCFFWGWFMELDSILVHKRPFSSHLDLTLGEQTICINPSNKQLLFSLEYCQFWSNIFLFTTTCSLS